jgi:hypothetical protein
MYLLNKILKNINIALSFIKIHLFLFFIKIVRKFKVYKD